MSARLKSLPNRFWVRRTLANDIRSFTSKPEYDAPFQDMRVALARIGDSLTGRYGTYSIHSLAGQGGVADIYRVLDRGCQPYAAKLLRRAFLLENLGAGFSQKDARAFILQEALVMAVADAPGVMPIIDFGLTTFHDPFIIMPLIKGKTLADEIDYFFENHKFFPLNRAVEVAIAICERVSCLHATGIIHADLKPSNIFFTEDRPFSPLLFDLGFARFMKSVRNIIDPASPDGSISNMAPEQFLGIFSPRIDVYGIGTILYDMLTGKPPLFLGDRRSDPYLPVLAPHKIKARVPKRLEEVVLRCLSVNHDERPRSARALQDELETFL